MKRVTVFALVFALILSVSAFAEDRIAIVDIVLCMSKSTAAQRAQDELKAYENERNTKFKKLQDEQAKKEGDFQKTAGALSEVARKARIDELTKGRAGLEATFRQYSAEVQKKEQELTAKIQKEMQSYIEAIAREQKYTLVLPVQAMVYTDGSYPNISQQVIDRYNKASGKKR
ncbi:hypothetical protein RsTz2092_01250 [Deferribacterales bacterium RsTz2092]|nr:hypothetical protein AGMMS49941_02020 [Deferribacterales bacterium]